MPAHDVLFGASLGQWNGADAAVLEHHAAGFIYRNTDDTPADEARARWATEIVPAVREGINRQAPLNPDGPHPAPP